MSAPHPALVAAKARLDTLDWYPRPVRIERVGLVVSKAAFRLPWLRRFDGYSTHLVILLRRQPHDGRDDLVTHELCHVWQMQHRPIHMPLSYLWRGYRDNPYEQEARRAAAVTGEVAVHVH